MNANNRRTAAFQQILQELDMATTRLDINSDTMPTSETSSNRSPTSSFTEDDSQSTQTPQTDKETLPDQPTFEQGRTNTDFRRNLYFQCAVTTAASLQKIRYAMENAEPFPFLDYSFNQQAAAYYLKAQQLHTNKLYEEAEKAKRQRLVSSLGAANSPYLVYSQAGHSGQSMNFLLNRDYQSFEAAAMHSGVPRNTLSTPDIPRMRAPTGHSLDEARDAERRSYIQLADSNNIYTNVLHMNTTETNRIMQYSYSSTQLHAEGNYNAGASNVSQIKQRYFAQHGNFYPFNESATQYYERKQLQAAKAKRISSILANQSSRPLSSRTLEFQKIVSEVKSVGKYPPSQSPTPSSNSDKSDLFGKYDHPLQYSHGDENQFASNDEFHMDYAGSVKHEELQKESKVDEKLRSHWPPPSPPPAKESTKGIPSHLTNMNVYQIYADAQLFDERNKGAITDTSEEIATSETESTSTEEIQSKKLPKEPYSVSENEVIYGNRNVLELGSNLRRGPIVSPSVIHNNVQSVVSNCSQVSRMCGWKVPPHITYKCPDPDCAFEEQHFIPQ